jgi:hypothetical protein
MSTFFKPIRRKIGVLTLLMACLLMLAWLRSTADQDAVFIHRERNALIDNHVLISMHGALSWSRWSPIDTDTPRRWKYRQAKNPGISDEDWNGADIHWRWRWNGFDFISASFKETVWQGQPKSWIRDVDVWQIPYWSLVIPLTFLSTYLLLSKPRSANGRRS